MTIYNFSAGPAVLPKTVLQQAQAELPDWHGSGMSVMEMSHRGKEFIGIAAQAEADLRELMNIPVNYKVLFLQGGASQQFAMIPLNLLRGKTTVDYLNTGAWSKKAIKEAKKFATVNVVATGEDKNFSYIPEFDTWKCDVNAAYLHYTPNETIGGVEFNWVPDSGEVPLVADMSSCILSRPIDVSKFALIYAGSQKNIGPAGLTIVIVREDLIGDVASGTPTMLDYKTHADNDSMYNTPPTYAIYMAGLVFQLLKNNGGIEEMHEVNKKKAAVLYDEIDRNRLFRPTVVDHNDRSLMNICFVMNEGYDALEKPFLDFATSQGMVGIKGHRSVGGFRASTYNALPVESVKALVATMKEFEKNNS